MKNNQKFNPDNINEIQTTSQDNLFGNIGDEKEQINVMKNLQEINHKARDQEMKEMWSKLLRIYLTIFTIAMFITLWGNESTFYSFCYSSHCVNLGRFDLGETTLNFLITVGFAKVVGVVWLIVSHLFPKKNPKKNKLGNNHN